MGRQRIVLRSVEETLALGRQLAATLVAGDVMALYGELGAGKTHLAKGIALGLGLATSDVVQSPTFVKLAIYETTPILFHFDLYRMHCEKEFIALGFEEFLASRGVALIEWPERIESLLPSHTLKVALSHGANEQERIAEFFA